MSLSGRAAEAIGRRMCFDSAGFYDKVEWTRVGAGFLAVTVDDLPLAGHLNRGEVALRLLRLFAAVGADGSSDPDVWCEEGRWVQWDGKAHANPVADADPEAAALLVSLAGGEADQLTAEHAALLAVATTAARLDEVFMGSEALNSDKVDAALQANHDALVAWKAAR